MIGLFGLSEVLRAVTAKRGESMPIPKVEGRGALRDSLTAIWRNKGRVGSGSVIGGVVGALPGAGADIAAWISYAFTRATSRVRKGKTADDSRVEAIAGASSANNAGIASAYVPTLAFGIPGDTITAILIGVLLVKGITPGPDLFLYQTDTLYAIYIIFIVANLLLLPLGFLLIRVSGFVLRAPRSVLMGLIVAISICGAFAINNGYLEVGLMVVFGVLGFLFEKGGIPLAPVVLGIVLGPIVERNFMQSVIKTNWDLAQFFTRPISAVLIVLVILAIASSPLMSWLGKRAERTAALNAALHRAINADAGVASYLGPCLVGCPAASGALPRCPPVTSPSTPGPSRPHRTPGRGWPCARTHPVRLPPPRRRGTAPPPARSRGGAAAPGRHRYLRI